MLRMPSYSPPPFDADVPPPPLMTPPPNYEAAVGDTSGALADYFKRFAADEDTDDEGRPGARRMRGLNLPLTPGGRVNRSMDETRS